MSIKDRGFASMLRSQQREIARLGGKAVQAKGTGHRFTTKTAQIAGQIGRANQAAKRQAAQS